VFNDYEIIDRCILSAMRCIATYKMWWMMLCRRNF